MTTKTTRTTKNLLGQKTYKAKQWIPYSSVVKDFSVTNRVLVPEDSRVRDFFPINQAKARMVADDILKVVWEDVKEEERFHFGSLLFGLLKSVRGEVMKFLVENEPRDCEIRLEKDYSAMGKIKPDEFFESPIPRQRILHKFKFFEQVYDKRVFIQNYRWDFKDLDCCIASFIRDREKYKMYVTDYDKFKKDGQECISCYHRCVSNVNGICLFCQDYEKLLFFINICQFFKVLGSMYLFFWFVDYSSIDYIFNHPDRFAPIFKKKTFDFSTIEKYCIYEQLERTLLPPPEPIVLYDENGNRIKTPEELHEEIVAGVEEDYQKKKEEKRKVEIEKYSLLLALQKRRKEVRAKERKEQIDEFKKSDLAKNLLHVNKEKKYIAQHKTSKDTEKKVEKLGMLKTTLDETGIPKYISSFGEKSLK